MEKAIVRSDALIPTQEAEIKDVFSESTFESMGLAYGLLKSLNKMGFTTLTKIQMEIYGTIHRKANAIVRSVTGSGKTLAYMVPILQDLLTIGHKISRSDGIFVVILSPTRELCTQIYEVCIKLCQGCVNIVPGMLVGGEDINHEKSRLRKGINILVSTPARLLYHLEKTKNHNVRVMLIACLSPNVNNNNKLRL